MSESEQHLLQAGKACPWPPLHIAAGNLSARFFLSLVPRGGCGVRGWVRPAQGGLGGTPRDQKGAFLYFRREAPNIFLGGQN